MCLAQNATVTLCHSRTRDLRRAGAAGPMSSLPRSAGRRWSRGTGSRRARWSSMSASTGSARRNWSATWSSKPLPASGPRAITPVPGGVGPMTITMLLYNTVESAKRRKQARSEMGPDRQISTCRHRVTRHGPYDHQRAENPTKNSSRPWRTRPVCFLVGCAACATACKSGGEEEVFLMQEWLASLGKEVTGSVVIDEACHIMRAARDLRQRRLQVEEAEALLVLACGAGVQSISAGTDGGSSVPSIPCFSATSAASDSTNRNAPSAANASSTRRRASAPSPTAPRGC